MYGRCVVRSAVLRGVEAIPVDVEVAVTSGTVGFFVVGMVDAAVQEARERVRAALKVAGFSMPARRILVNLAPSALRKTGSGFDLAIAMGVLVATGQIDRELVRDALVVGELSLDGGDKFLGGWGVEYIHQYKLLCSNTNPCRELPPGGSKGDRALSGRNNSTDWNCKYTKNLRYTYILE